MTSDLSDLIRTSFYLMYHLNLQPSEVDTLSTYEVREYLNLLRENKKIEAENDSNIFKLFKKLFGLTGKTR